MKTLEMADTDLSQCVKQASSQSVLILKKGKPVALVSNVEGLDAEQIQLGTNAEFWKLIQHRRHQKTIPWEALKKRLSKLRD